MNLDHEHFLNTFLNLKKQTLEAKCKYFHLTIAEKSHNLRVITSVVFFFFLQYSIFNNSSESEMKADVLVMKHEEVSHMATRCAATRSAHLHIIPLKY